MEAESQKKTCTFEGDLELVRRHQNADPQALDDLFRVHRRLLMYWVRKVWRRADREEVLQEVIIGLSRAAMEFDAAKTDNFHGQVRSCVMKTVYESKAVMPVKRTLYQNYRRVIAAQDALLEKLDRKPTIKELSEAAELSVKQVENALNVIAAFPFPLEDEDGQLAIEEPYQVEDPYQSQLIKDALKQLGSDDAHVIIRYYYYDETDPEIAAGLGKSKDAVKMMRTRALEKLRAIIEGEGV